MILINNQEKQLIKAGATKARSTAIPVWAACTGISMAASTIFNIASGIVSMVNGNNKDVSTNYTNKKTSYIRVSPIPYRSSFSMWI